MDDEEFELTDSDDDYSKEDKLLLEEARASMRRKEISSDEEVYGFGGSEDDEDEDDNDDDDDDDDEDEDNEKEVEMASDLEDSERKIDDRAWGKKKKNFYSTDFVDQDYQDVYQGEEAEEAELEEQEARNIQKRLVEQLNDADFSINEVVNIAEATEATTKSEVIKTDLSKLTKRQKIDLVKKESPEYFVLINDFKEKLQEVQKFMPVINYFESKVKESFPALEFLRTKLTLILNYCTNISYYLLLKAKRIPIKNHPVLKSLYNYRNLLQQIETTDKNVIQPQLDKILEKIKSGESIEIDESLVKTKTTLKLLSKKQKARKALEEEKQNTESADEINDMDVSEEENENQNKEKHQLVETNKKRAITYEMAKNKGLIPKRSKEQRNPRVKHRRKYEKAKIRRRGQVRTPRTEIPLYGGEPTGIKTGLTKSIKFKY